MPMKTDSFGREEPYYGAPSVVMLESRRVGGLGYVGIFDSWNSCMQESSDRGAQLAKKQVPRVEAT